MDENRYNILSTKLKNFTLHTVIISKISFHFNEIKIFISAQNVCMSIFFLNKRIKNLLRKKKKINLIIYFKD